MIAQEDLVQEPLVVAEQTNTWSNERVELLLTLFAEGLSARQIGNELGCTRNAILGKIHRLGLWRSEEVLKKARTQKTDSEPHGQLVARMISARATQALRSGSAPPAQSPKHVAGNKTILELDLRDCRWPLGDEAPARFFCGAKALPDKPYCRKHYRISSGVRIRGS
jgi:GcrA cell cycle regulator